MGEVEGISLNILYFPEDIMQLERVLQEQACIIFNERIEMCAESGQREHKRYFINQLSMI
jgi:hypothetical protein